MGYTTFTGPIRAGNILNTSGITPGVNVSNVGQVVMAQSAAIAEGTNVFTEISIPAYSQILSIELRATIPFVNPVSIGNTYDGVTVNDPIYFASATPVPINTGVTTITTSTTGQNDNWLNIGYPDSQIVVVCGGTNAGRGVLTVTYLQGPNGNA